MNDYRSISLLLSWDRFLQPLFFLRIYIRHNAENNKKRNNYIKNQIKNQRKRIWRMHFFLSARNSKRIHLYDRKNNQRRNATSLNLTLPYVRQNKAPAFWILVHKLGHPHQVRFVFLQKKTYLKLINYLLYLLHCRNRRCD